MLENKHISFSFTYKCNWYPSNHRQNYQNILFLLWCLLLWLYVTQIHIVYKLYKTSYLCSLVICYSTVKSWSIGIFFSLFKQFCQKAHFFMEQVILEFCLNLPVLILNVKRDANPEWKKEKKIKKAEANNLLQLPDQNSLLVNEQFEKAPQLSFLPPHGFCVVLLNFTFPFSIALHFF